MADKGATSGSGSVAPKKAVRRTGKTGGAPARARNQPGNPGYAGYNYQIEVSVWVALDLILAKGLTTAVEIEPRSDEDLEAAVADPSAGKLGIEATGTQLKLVLQAKTRSGGPWTAAAFDDVLKGTDRGATAKGRKRSRPLQMLKDDPRRHYVFVTNEASAEALRPHEGEHLLDFPEVEELPPHARQGIDADIQAEIAPRILILAGVDREKLGLRIATILTQQGHVPGARQPACLDDLRKAASTRLEGAHGGIWTRHDIMAVLVHHGGSLAPTRAMDHYVQPRSFEAIQQRLDRDHAVVIAGPSGTGKTLTGDILELGLRQGVPPFDVIGEEHGPGYIRGQLTRGDAILFHLRDPWGGNRLTPGADRWSGELPKLLESAGAGRKFLITSRSDVLRSAGLDLMKDLAPFIENINVEDYGAERIAKIYDAIAGDFSGGVRELAMRYRARALAALSRPYEIRRFLTALTNEDVEKPRAVDAIIEDSQIDAISRVISEQIAPFGRDGIQSAAVIWAMLTGRGAVARSVFARLVRRLRGVEPTMRPDVDGLIDFLTAGQNLRQDGAALSFQHPRVEDGLRLTFLRDTREAEHVLGMTIDALVAWDDEGADWGVETAVAILRQTSRITDIELSLRPDTVDRLDRHLLAVCLSGKDRIDYGRALGDLARLGSLDHLPSRLARILIEGGQSTDQSAFGRRWRAPAVEEAEIERLAADSATRLLIERFIGDELPFTNVDFDRAFVEIAGRLAGDLRESYWSALETIAGPAGPTSNIDVIVEGALTGEAPDYERAIERFVRSEAKADREAEALQSDIHEAQEHAVDADAADHIMEEPGDNYYNARQGMKAIVALRRQREGIDWIDGHAHQPLLNYALGDLLTSRAEHPDPNELRFLVATSREWVRGQAWAAVEQHWDPSLEELLVAEFAAPELGTMGDRRRLIAIAALAGAGDPLPIVVRAVPAISAVRHLELVFDLFATPIEGDARGDGGTAQRRTRAERLATALPPDEQELATALIGALASEDLGSHAASLSSDARSALETQLAEASTDLTAPLAFLAQAGGIDVSKAITRLLSSDDADDGLMALRLARLGGAAEAGSFEAAALVHRRYAVRREALRLIVPELEVGRRPAIVALGRDDPSADVRLAFAQLITQHRWPEAVEALEALLGDTRNFVSMQGGGPVWARFSVARQAAAALGAYDDLPDHAIERLFDCVWGDGRDPFVACAALRALAKHDDDRILPALTAALGAPGLAGAVAHRPLAQAAACAVCDRVLAGRLEELSPAILDIAETAELPVAGPLLMAAGIRGGNARDTMLARLRQPEQREQAMLVRLAAIVEGAVDGLVLEPFEELLVHLAHQGGVGPEGRAQLESWSQSLDLAGGWTRYQAWIAQLLELPLAGDLGNIEAYDLPDRIGVMTMRSFTPHREEDQSPDDGS